MKPSIVIAPFPRTVDEIFDPESWAELGELAEIVWGVDSPMPEDDLVSALADATAVAFGDWRYGPETLRAAGPQMAAMFEVLGTFDYPAFDYQTCFDRGIAVGSIAPAFGPVVAEMCLALALSAARGVGKSDRRFRSKTEEYLHAGNVGSSSLLGKTVGFLGCGSLSRSLQSLLGPFGVELLGYDPWLDDMALADRGIERVELPDLFDRANVLFVLAVPTPTNKKIVSADLMLRLDPQDVLVVGSRAHVVDFDALTDQVRAGRFRAGIDVFPSEPLPLDHPIREAEGAVLTAHLAGALPDALLQIGRMITADFEAISTGSELRVMQYANPDMISSLRSFPGQR